MPSLNLTKKQKVEALFLDILAALRAETETLAEEIGISLDDPVADCRVVVDDEKVMLTFDGAGYDLFSHQAWMVNPITGKGYSPSQTNRDAIEKALKEVDPNLYFEDCNPWSLAVWMN
jgi:hypothetical protein